ncbi:alpha/beta hydrolase [Agromyces sp. NPDC049794]|uniref:alpha/beta fold hydrolase n=1 Tax=unclassified Agromyces TaxID=2639701 RepID=UPI0033DE5E20
MNTERAGTNGDETSPSAGRGGLSRRGLIGGVAAATGISILAGAASPAAARNGGQYGSAVDAPQLPDGFLDTFEDRFVHANGIRQHAVIGGDGPPLLLVHGWPENWYAWRFLMPTLAQAFTVVAVDQRGIGLTDTPADGYDSATLADDLAALMGELGHDRFALVGHDTGYIISYALAADHRDRVERMVVAEIPGPPGLVDEEHPPPPLFLPEFLNNRLWHIPFNRVDDELIINMVRSNADEFYRYEFAIQGGGQTLPNPVIRYYVDLYNRNKDALRASFGLYRAWDATLEQNGQRQQEKLTIPVLGIGGENSWGPAAAGGILPAAINVETAVIPGVGHWVAEQAPEEMLGLLTSFLEAA